jgi:iron(III) transport system permease protein
MLQYASPGTVLGLALILLYNRFLPVVYGSVFMIIIGYILKFIPQSQQGIQSAITQIHSHYEEAARSLGAGWWLRTRQVLIPLIRPGLVASWVLVFVSSMKELAATLLLRPAGFDTLPVRIWIHTVEADYAKAASVALFLLTITAIPILLFQNTLWRREGRI